MRKIALIMDGWKRFFTYAWPSGILQRIRERDEEVNLYIFNSSGDWSLDKDYNLGEYNIYNLPDLTDFDGIILDLNNIRYSKVRENVIAMAKKSGKPVISIANEIEDFYFVGINNYRSMYTMIDHLTQNHNCKNFWFIMGPESNYENMVRTQALKDYLVEHELHGSMEHFYFESYDFRCGISGFEKMLQEHHQLPDAVVCANDNIAVGVCEAAKTHGYQAPKDFLVTGFDNFDKASYYAPAITTVEHIREEVGYLCADVLFRIWNGEKVEHFNYTDSRLIFSESCGCEKSINKDSRAYARDQILYGIETTEFEEQMLSFEYELMQCNTINEMTLKILKCVPAFQCDAIYIVLDDTINNFKKETDYFEKHLMADEEFLTEGYPKEMSLEFAYENGKNTKIQQKSVKNLFPLFEHEQGGTDFLFMPLHFKDRAVGYVVIRNAVYLMKKQFLFQAVNSLTTAMENLHKKEKLEYLNQMLSELYVKDSMTNLYNRIGYQKFACRMFEEKKRKKENLIIMFIDMDRLKYINDTYGHEYGDFAIKTIANALHHICPKDAITIRNGGDEFLVILPQRSSDELSKMMCEIRTEISMQSEKMCFPFPISISIGCKVTDMMLSNTLDDYVRMADEIMYQEKVEKKAARTNLEIKIV